MKATLKFNLPEETSEHYDAINGTNYSLVLWDLDQWLRNMIKYNPEGYPVKEIDAFVKARETLNELMNDHNVVFDA